MIKRLAAAASVAAIAAVGIAPAASAAPKAKTPIVTVIDWDAPAPTSGGYSTRAIDWD